MEKRSGADAPKNAPCNRWEPSTGLLNQHKQRAAKKRGFAGCLQKVLHLTLQNLKLSIVITSGSHATLIILIFFTVSFGNLRLPQSCKEMSQNKFLKTITLSEAYIFQTLFYAQVT